MNRSKTKAVFLDRDGVLIEDVHYLSDLDQIRLFSDVPSSLKKLKAIDFLLIVVTNQSGVARGFFSEDFVREANKKINHQLSEHNVQLDYFYYCPHHLAGNSPYNIRCECRKPLPGMILQAVEEHCIDLSASYMIGDNISDIELADNVDIPGLLVKTGHGLHHAAEISVRFPNNKQFPSFKSAVDYIISEAE